MRNNIKNSQFADRNSQINESSNQNKISVNRIRTESAIISFVVGTLSAIAASFVYDHFFK